MLTIDETSRCPLDCPALPVNLPTGTSLLNVHERFVEHLEEYMLRCATEGT